MVKAGKKVWMVAFLGVTIPFVITSFVFSYIKANMGSLLQVHSATSMIIFSSMVFTSFQVIHFILTDVKLMSSEIGRLALTIAVLSDFFGLTMVVVFEAFEQGEKEKHYLWYFMSSVFVIISLLVVSLPQVVKWINKRTPEGKSVDQNYIVATLLTVFVIGFFTDYIGAAVGTGPIWLGLAMPNGPPMGAAIKQKTEIVLNYILMPFAYATVGLNTDVFAVIESWNSLVPMFLVVLFVFFAKLVTNAMLAPFMEISYKDSFILSIMLSFKGQTDYFLCLHWMDLKIIETPSFTMLVTLSTIETAIFCPIIDYMYDPKKSYLINIQRTIEHTMQGSELRILACIYDQESVASLFSLLDFANPTSSNPFKVYTLYLIELLGRGTPMLIDHAKNTNVVYWDNNNEVIHNAIKHYAEARTNTITMRSFTSVTPSRTMYQDICDMALLYKVKFIILPFHKKSIKDGSEFSTEVRPGVQSSNANILSNAPCSVGILACKNDDIWGTNSSPIFLRIHCQFVMLFLGGHDAREALSLAGRMAEHPNVSLIVFRILPSEDREYNKSERKMDDGVVACFEVQNEWNDRVVYKEVFVDNGLDTVSALQSLNNSIPVDLWIVGRKNGIDSILLKGLSDWSDNPELGLIGDFLVSMDVNTLGGSVLIVQQQMLRNPESIPWGC
ncbi:cation/H(+) antiporter 24-like [Chenopodium quinoa]|nr:cation/H(+) antiporter 24-like [Chenopodium quinoa]